MGTEKTKRKISVLTHFLLSGGKVVRLSHKNATHAKESVKNVKFKHKGQFKNTIQ